MEVLPGDKRYLNEDNPFLQEKNVLLGISSKFIHRTLTLGKFGIGINRYLA